jgi:hypothetical protein
MPLFSSQCCPLMAYSDELSGGRISGDMPGNRYEHVRVSDNARAHLGDTYHIGELKQEHQRRRDGC